jgi:hypothetical protein
MLAFAADREVEAARLAVDTRTQLKRRMLRPADALLDAHAAMLAAAGRAEVAELERATLEAEAAWRELFRTPELRTDLRVGIDFIASGILEVAASRGLVPATNPMFVLPPNEPEWVRGIVVAERGTGGRCPVCDAGIAALTSFPEPPWPSTREWLTAPGPLDGGGVRYRRVPDASPRFVVSVLSPPASWCRCPECTAVLFPLAYLEEVNRAIWQVDFTASWSEAARCAWAPARCFVEGWPPPSTPVDSAILDWVVQDLTR